MQQTYVHPAGTSWSAVLGGWIAALGATTLVAPLVAGILAGRAPVANDLALAVPVVLGLMIAYLVGGYVAGRMAAYHTSWHGMMTSFFGLFLVLIGLLLAAAAEEGLFAASGVRSLADVFPGTRELDLRTLGDTVTFGAILGFLATIFAGWLGGLLAARHGPEALSAPSLAARPGSDPVLREESPIERRGLPRFRLLPAIGRRGGERVAAAHEEVRETRVGP
jgi:MFS family permease